MNDSRPSLLARRNKALGPGYRLFYKQPLHIVRGEGATLFDSDGVAYLDAYNNVPCIGHSNPAVLAAVTTQLSQLNTHTRYLHENIVNYSEQLLASTGGEMDHVIFTCSGSEAIDLALRIAAAHTSSTGVVVTENAYHGTTTRVAQVSPSMGPATNLGADVRLAPVPNVFTGDGVDVSAEMAASVERAAAQLERHGIGFSALLIDTVLSSDGLLVDEPGFLKATQEVVHARGGVFIADEVQAGFGRTGSMWGYQRHGLHPDLVVLGKPMGNGMPIGAVMVKAHVLELFNNGADYFNTFGGNAVSIVAAQAVLDHLQTPGFLDSVVSTGAYLRTQFDAVAARYPFLGRVRSAGLFFSIDCVDWAGQPSKAIAEQLVEELQHHRVLIGTCGIGRDILKFRPPLVITLAEAELLVARLDAALQSFSAANA